jgi:hypothetical protein
MKKTVRLTEADLHRVIKKIIRESTILKEVNQVKNIRDINWYALISSGRGVVQVELDNIIKIPYDFRGLVYELEFSLTSNLKESIESDVINGNLSANTVKILNGNINNAVNTIFKDPKLNAEFNKIPGPKKSLAKNLGSWKIKNMVNDSITLLGDKFYKEGMVGGLKYYNPNSPIVKNYVKVLNQLGTNISNNQLLKDRVFNLIMSKL